jgi:hypothetical protein
MCTERKSAERCTTGKDMGNDIVRNGIQRKGTERKCIAKGMMRNGTRKGTRKGMGRKALEEATCG